MAQEIHNKFSESCLNLVLRNSEYFISAYPGKIVFGKTNPVGYKNFEYFEFRVFELHHLYLAIFDIIENFAKSLAFDYQLLLAKSEINYAFSVKTITDFSEEYQVAHFIIEKESNIVFNLSFSITEFDSFLYSLVKVIPSSLCLNTIEYSLFQKATQEKLKTIHDFQEESNCLNFVERFLTDREDNNQNKSVTNLVAFLSYYCEIILIFHKIQSLVTNKSFDNLASIISKTAKD